MGDVKQVEAASAWDLCISLHRVHRSKGPKNSRWRLLLEVETPVGGGEPLMGLRAPMLLPIFGIRRAGNVFILIIFPDPDSSGG